MFAKKAYVPLNANSFHHPIGNVVNGTIGKQMVDMLVESFSNVELILRFFDMFLKLKDLTSSDAFKEFDPDRRGLISKKDIQKAMEACRLYSLSDTEFLLSCMETDDGELLDYQAFVKRFHEPAKDIGFNIAVLLTNLSEHMPGDARLHKFLELAESVLRYISRPCTFLPFVASATRFHGDDSDKNQRTALYEQVLSLNLSCCCYRE